MKFLESNKILSDFQHAFQKRRSCETQIIITIHDLAVGLDRRQQVDVTLLDFSKALDKVPHHHLAVNSVLQVLGWEDLQSRRDQNKAIMMYSIVNNLVEIPAGQ